MSFGEKFKDKTGFFKSFNRPGKINGTQDDRRMLTIQVEVDPCEADHLRSMPGMDDAQFVAFLMPCIQTSILKTIQQG
ncbi:hypothetical protein, partial [Streptomyces europaeiscabiei]|uniref:hypothetical protein n=1 Tax=Streptomyces europaeiscabiei TaxID=146819 RepID=UPI0038F79F4B